MAIASEITRLQGAKADIKSAIEAKGVTVPSNALLDSYANYINSIATGTGLNYESGTVTLTADTARAQVNFTNSHTVPPSLVLFYDTSDTFPSNNTNIWFCWVDFWRIFGSSYKATGNSSGTRYSFIYVCYKGTTNAVTYTNKLFQYNSDNTETSSNSYPRYFVDTDKFYADGNGSTHYWRTNITYKWIAIWT